MSGFPEQEKALREFYRIVFDEIKKSETSQELAEELFHFVAFDNPDMIALKFLRARKWNIEKAKTMLINCLKWRLSYGLQRILEQGERSCEPKDLESGKMCINGKDKLGRPLVYVHIKKHNKDAANLEKTQNYAILAMETVRLLLSPPQEYVSVVFDMDGFSMSNMDYAFTKFLGTCLEAYYPECLGNLYIVNAPWIFNGCWTIIKPWLDPNVVSKVKFVSAQEILEFVSKENIPKSLWGIGESSFLCTFVPCSPQEEQEHQKRLEDTGARASLRKGIQEKGWLFLEAASKPSESFDVQVVKQTAASLNQAYIAYLPYGRARTHWHRIKLVRDL